MKSVILKNLSAVSENEYVATLDLEGREFTRRFVVKVHKGNEIVSPLEMGLDFESTSNARAIAAAVYAFHKAHQPEDPQAYAIDSEVEERGRASIVKDLTDYYRDHPDELPPEPQTS